MLDLGHGFGIAPLFGTRKPAPPLLEERAPAASSNTSPWRYAIDDGNKFHGGYGFTELLLIDYWTLRQRSAELYEKNLYARGLIRRLVTNEINVGLHLEATPEERLLGFPEDGLADWAETTENRFSLWANNPELCDQAEQKTFGALQAAARREALVVGDVLVVLRQDQRTQLPRIQLINGASVQTPLGAASRTGNKITHGVELDPTSRQVAYWVQQEDGTSKRLPARGEKSGRRLAWLLYGTDKREDQVRGKPLLALVLQSLKEIDRYRDSTQRKALVLSMLAMYIKKSDDKPGSQPMTMGARRRATAELATATVDAKDRQFRTAAHVPGLVIDELQQGEEPQAFQSNGTTEQFGEFERAILNSVAWANNLPPEVLTLAFGKAYAASQAAINELKLYLNVARTDFGNGFCQPAYIEWLRSQVLEKKVVAPGFLDAARDIRQYDTFAAWSSSDWTGQVKPATDLSKLTGGYVQMLDRALITGDRASRELTGTKFSKNVKKLKRENEQLAAALKPLAELKSAEKPPTLPAVSDDGGVPPEPDDETAEEDDDEDLAD